MSRIAILLLVLAVHAATTVNGQTPERPRVFLLVIDDLHLDFRETPRTRKLIQEILGTVAKDGDVWSVVSTGTSSLTLAPTTDLAAVRAAVRRMTGNALTTSTRLGAAAAAEHRRRAEVSYQTAADAISPIAAVPNRGALTVLYVSGGYDTRVAAPPSAVVEAATRVALDHVRSGAGPFFLECRTYRFRAHSMFDAELYRTKSEVEEWKARDPIAGLSARLKAEGSINEADLETIEREVTAEVADAVNFAESGTWEPIEDLTRFVYSERKMP
jgi:hypothetical protein